MEDDIDGRVEGTFIGVPNQHVNESLKEINDTRRLLGFGHTGAARIFTHFTHEEDEILIQSRDLAFDIHRVRSLEGGLCFHRH